MLAGADYGHSSPNVTHRLLAGLGGLPGPDRGIGGELSMIEAERERIRRQERIRAVKAEKEKLMLELEEQR